MSSSEVINVRPKPSILGLSLFLQQIRVQFYLYAYTVVLYLDNTSATAEIFAFL